VDNKCLQEVKNFKFLGCEISYENEGDIQQKLAKFAQTLGILNNTFKTDLVQKFSRIKVYNVPAIHILLYGSGNRSRKKKKDEKRLTSIEMNFFRRTTGCTLFDYENNEEILEELRAGPIDEKLRKYKSYWLRHVTKFNKSRMP
jgi:hypothetical protein